MNYLELCVPQVPTMFLTLDLSVQIQYSRCIELTAIDTITAITCTWRNRDTYT